VALQCENISVIFSLENICISQITFLTLQKDYYGMADSITIFHGSNVVVEKPQIIVSGFYKDFGFGFYCTNIERQAKKWAQTKKGDSFVSVYNYLPTDELKVLSFPVMTDEWLDFVVACRRGIKHEYDIVEGPMADDQIWDYVEDFIEGNITREAFWVLAKFKYPTHQIVFCTQKSLDSIVFEKSYSL